MGNNNSHTVSRKRSNSTIVTPSLYSPPTTNLNRTRSKSLIYSQLPLDQLDLNNENNINNSSSSSNNKPNGHHRNISLGNYNQSSKSSKSSSKKNTSTKNTKANNSTNIAGTNQPFNIEIPTLKINDDEQKQVITPRNIISPRSSNDTTPMATSTSTTPQIIDIREIILNQILNNNGNNNEIDWSFKNLNNIDLEFSEYDFTNNNTTNSNNNNNNNIKKIDLSQNNLSSIPKLICEISTYNSIEVLNLYRNQISDLNNLVGSESFKRIEKLILSNNDITDETLNNGSDDKSFCPINRLITLKYLSLASNKITRAFPNLSELVNLEKLSLDRNQIRCGDDEDLDGPSNRLPCNLKSLTVSFNQFTSIPFSIYNCLTLRELNISNNKLLGLPKELNQLIYLESLDCSFNKISTIPLESFTNFKNLKNLDLQSNNLKSLPSSIGNCINLTNLNCSNNQLEIIPIEITHLLNLTILYLDNNKIKSLNNWLLSNNNNSNNQTSIMKISELYISGNGLESIEPICKKMATLHTLSANFNKLLEIPNSISQILNLCKLELNENQISVLPKSITEMKSLYEIDLSNNKIEQLPIEIIRMNWLQELQLFRNPILLLIPKQLQRKNLIGIKEYLKSLHK